MKRAPVPIFALILFALGFVGVAQEIEPPKPKGVRLQFVPPPMDGTISLGIYDAAGKLVRILHSQAETKEFGIGLNGLITSWDGKNDAAEPMPAGKYHARGFMVGDVKIDGEAFLGNDWIDDDAPRIKKILKLIAYAPEPGTLIFSAVTADEKTGAFPFDLKKGKLGAALNDDKLVGLDAPSPATPGKNETLWKIEKGEATAVKNFTRDGKLRVTIPCQPGEPDPKQIISSDAEETIFLLEENADSQRVRGLTLAAPKVAPTPAEKSAGGEATPPDFTVFFEKKIRLSADYGQVKQELKFPDNKPFVPQEKIAVPLRPNPLNRGERGAMQISVGIDANGSFLKTTDGLPLRRLSETKNLRWIVCGREIESSPITIFQGDGAVIEQFKVTRMSSVMSFDCGEFDYDAKEK